VFKRARPDSEQVPIKIT